ncbi:MAG: hypothetical protein IPN29_12550 [Saprospiraceae bacterium]|nr:hypothetical protein [Saprospiraceae bacterium]
MKAANILAFSFFCLVSSSGWAQEADLQRHFKTDLFMYPDTASTGLKFRFQSQPQGPLPFFCRIEELTSKAGGLFLKFRLGNAAYVDKLENKKGTAIKVD